MTIDTWLRIGAIGLPLIGALTIWRWGDKFLHAQRWLAVSIFGIIGLIALSLFLLNRHYACILLPGRQNCLFDGLATLSLFLLNLVLARTSVVLRGENKGYDYILMLLLSSAWAGMGLGLAENLGVFLVFLFLFFFVLNRYMKKKGFSGGFLKIRDDYEDDQK
jgi:hypothetical protein